MAQAKPVWDTGAAWPQVRIRWRRIGAGRMPLATKAGMNQPTPLLPAPSHVVAYSYQRRTPETSLLRRIVMAQWPGLERAVREATDGRSLPRFIRKAVDGFIKCGMLGHGFLRLFCRTCKTDQLVAFSCKVRGLCSSCDGRRMTELAAHIVDSVIPVVPVRQFVLTLRNRPTRTAYRAQRRPCTLRTSRL